jgi:hypothetical protein
MRGARRFVTLILHSESKSLAESFWQVNGCSTDFIDDTAFWKCWIAFRLVWPGFADLEGIPI